MIADLSDSMIAAGVEGLAELFASGAATPLDALQVSLARIERLNALNAVLAIDRQGAVRDAEASGRRWAAGAPLSKLDGVPIGVKANIAVAGLPWHGGVEAYRDRIATRDAEAVKRLRKAGAVVLGTLNMHEAALGATNDNSAFGRCHNPYRHGFTPGGSSGGSAAAVAAGLCAAALGTDTLGSVRIPAGYCGVFGYKPVHGRLPLGGVMPLSPSYDDLGVLARSAADLSMVVGELSHSVGPNTRDWSGRDWGARELDGGEASMPIRCGIIDLAGQTEMDPDVQGAFERTVETARAAGWRVERRTLQDWDAAVMRRLGLLVVEVECLAQHRAMMEQTPSGFSPALRAMLDWAARQAPEKLANAQLKLEAAAQNLRRQLGDLEAILIPTTGAPAFSFDTPPPVGQADFTIIANLSGLAATALPIGLGPQGLPLSAQVLSASGSLSIRLAAALTIPARSPPGI